MNLQELPEVVLEKIFSYLTYNQIAENRVVCRKFNQLGKELLNRGYYTVERFHKRSLKAVKSELPRRESERKTHPLARRCEMLVAIETRLSMLSMTFLKHIETKQCCFIPGKVLDELLRVLRCVNLTTCPPFDLLQELRDISSMAMEHFDEAIVPQLKVKLASSKASTSLLHSVGDRNSCHSLNSLPFKDFLSAFRQNLLRTKSNCNHITGLFVETHSIAKKSARNERAIRNLTNQVVIQRRWIRRQQRIINNWEEKFRDLSAEVRKRRIDKTLAIPSASTIGEDAEAGSPEKRQKTE